MKLILASASPRRKDILKDVGYDFTITPADFDESSISLEKPEEGVLKLAKGKANAAFQGQEDAVVLGADTIVVCDGKVMLKPKDELDAANMLRMLSGKTHQVFTAVSLVSKDREESFVVKTDVTFFSLSDEEIERYVKTGEPLDKAGAYGIQGKGCALVEKIDGDYFSVVGLPIAPVMRALSTFGVYPV